MASYTQAGRQLSITTPLGKDVLLLTGLQGSEGISRPFHFHLELLAENQTEIAFDKLLGQGVTVNLALPKEKVRHFHGIVKSITQGDHDDVFTSYRVEIVPQFWLWTRRTQSRLFQHKTVPDILKEVLAGLEVKFEIQGAFHPRNYCAQYAESDFAFASRLMEEEGIYYYFKHTNGAHQMVVANTPPSHADVPEFPKVIYESIAGGKREDDRVWTWRKSQEVCSGKYTLWDHHFELPGKDLAAEATISDSVTVGKVTHKLKVAGNDKLETYVFPGGFARRFDGVDKSGAGRPGDLQKIFEDNQRTCKLRMDAEAAGSLRIQGSSACRQFSSGHKFTLERHGHGDGAYVLTAVEHLARLPGGIRQGAEQSLNYENIFTCIPAALAFRPPRSTPKPVMHGTQSATVVGPGGQDVHCDKYGRVKVQFHWDRQGQFDGDSSCWVRVAQFWAGKSWGAFFWPRIGHEVVVAFEEGDPDRPIIIGSVYNAQNMPPYPMPARQLVNGIKSCSERGDPGSNFNGLIFYDVPGDEHVQLHSERYERTKNEVSKHQHIGQTLVTIVGNLNGGGGSGSGSGPGGSGSGAGPGGSGSGAGPDPAKPPAPPKKLTPAQQAVADAKAAAKEAKDAQKAVEKKAQDAWDANQTAGAAAKTAQDAAEKAQKDLEAYKAEVAAEKDQEEKEDKRTFKWEGDILGDAAKVLDITFGQSYEATIGLSMSDTLGMSREITIDPFIIFPVGKGGVWEGIGGVLGSSEFKFCHDFACHSGLTFEVQRGPKLEFEDEQTAVVSSAGSAVAAASMALAVVVAGIGSQTLEMETLNNLWFGMNMVRQLLVGVSIGLESKHCHAQAANEKKKKAEELKQEIEQFVKDPKTFGESWWKVLLDAPKNGLLDAIDLTKQAAQAAAGGAAPSATQSTQLVNRNFTLKAYDISLDSSCPDKASNLTLQATGQGTNGNIIVSASQLATMASGGAQISVRDQVPGPQTPGILLETHANGTITLHEATLGKDVGPRIILTQDTITLAVGKDQQGTKITLGAGEIAFSVGKPDQGGLIKLTASELSQRIGKEVDGGRITLAADKLSQEVGADATGSKSILTTKDLTLQSGASHKATLSNTEVKLEATSATELSLKASAAEIKSVSATVDAKGRATFKGGMTKVEADGILTLKGSLSEIP